MQLAKYDPIYTVDQYLAIERAADERHIYLDGCIYMMAGESGEPGHPFPEIPAALRFIRGHGDLRQPGRAELKHRAEFRRQQLGLLSPRTPQGGAGAGKYRQIAKMIGEPQSHRAGV